MRGDDQIDREDCYICGDEGDLERHHIVPRRHGGPDDPSNLVDLCRSCHDALERLYNKDFYRELGAIGNGGSPRPADGHISGTVAKDIAEQLEDIESRVFHLKDSLEYGHYIYHDEHETDADTESETEADTEARTDEEWDVSVVETGTSDSEKERIKLVKDVIQEQEDEHDWGVPVEDVVGHAEQAGLDASSARDVIRKLRDQGDVYEPQNDHLRTV